MNDVEVYRVVDGDTVVLNVDLGFGSGVWLRGRHARLARINCPEMNTPKGKAAKERLRQLVAQAGQTNFQAQCSRLDKYGRLLVELFVKDSLANVSDLLVADGHAVLVGYGCEADEPEEL